MQRQQGVGAREDFRIVPSSVCLLASICNFAGLADVKLDLRPTIAYSAVPQVIQARPLGAGLVLGHAMPQPWNLLQACACVWLRFSGVFQAGSHGASFCPQL